MLTDPADAVPSAATHVLLCSLRKPDKLATLADVSHLAHLQNTVCIRQLGSQLRLERERVVTKWLCLVGGAACGTNSLGVRELKTRTLAVLSTHTCG